MRGRGLEPLPRAGLDPDLNSAALAFLVRSGDSGAWYGSALACSLGRLSRNVRLEPGFLVTLFAPRGASTVVEGVVGLFWYDDGDDDRLSQAAVIDGTFAREDGNNGRWLWLR